MDAIPIHDGFRSGENFFPTPYGNIHYAEAGKGSPVLFLHGNPTWSFMYRRFIRALSGEYRCIAPDYLGFGLSDNPTDFSYAPNDHAQIIRRFISENIDDTFTLVVHDWGGPIGLSYALEHPNAVEKIIIFNSWMWSLARIPRFRLLSRLHSGWPGQLITERFNLFVRWIMPVGFADYGRIPNDVRSEYYKPFRNPEQRTGTRVFPKSLLGSDRWLQQLWHQRSNLRDIPALILWGMKDRAFRSAQLDQWSQVFRRPIIHRQPDMGHYIPEESGEELIGTVQQFMNS